MCFGVSPRRKAVIVVCMCYRYVLQREALEALATRLAIPEPVEWGSRYNLAPGQDVLVVRAAAGTGSRGVELAKMRWGLVPAWAKGEAAATAPANARSESLASRSMFREAFRRRRCLVPASGFYEWKGPSCRRQPFLFRFVDGAALCFAGVWESWRNPADGQTVESCAIITTAPNERVRVVHDRMPAILGLDETVRWLDPGLTEPGDLAPLLHPYAGDALQSFPVTTRVNNVRFDDPACLEPAPPGGDGGDGAQLSFGL